MMRTRKFTWLLPLLMVFGGCSEEFEPKPLTYTQLLTGKVKKSWRASALQIREDGVVTADFDLPANDCVFDDQYVFYANYERQFEVLDSSLKCSPGDPDIIAADSWSFVNATATLEMVIPFLASFKLPFIVKELDERELVLEIWLDYEATDSYRIYFTAISTR